MTEAGELARTEIGDFVVDTDGRDVTAITGQVLAEAPGWSEVERAQ